MCYTTNANSKKAVPILSPAEKVIVSIFEAVAFTVVPKNHLIIFLFLRLSIGLFKKIFFILPLDKTAKVFYNVCGLFLPGLFVLLSQMVNKKADLLLKVDLFLL